MKKVNIIGAHSKSIDYMSAVYDFFESISEIAYIEDVYFVRSTKNRVFFHVGNITHGRYGYNYEADVFVSKKNLHVEIYQIATGGLLQIVTKSYLDTFKKVALEEDDNYEENNAYD